MRKRKLVFLLIMLMISLAPYYRIKAEEIKNVNKDTHTINSIISYNTPTIKVPVNSNELIAAEEGDNSICKNVQDVKFKSFILVLLFIIMIASKCVYTALKLKNYD